MNEAGHMTAEDGMKTDAEVLEIRVRELQLKEVLTPEDLAELLGISVWTIYAKTSKRNRDQVGIDLPPFFKLGKLIHFWRRDLISWLESRTRVDPDNKGDL